MLTKDLGSVPSTHIVAHRRAGDTYVHTNKILTHRESDKANNKDDDYNNKKKNRKF